ncbi:hypothetical protein [Bradyrhizobium sp. AZCC 1693]
MPGAHAITASDDHPIAFAVDLADSLAEIRPAVRLRAHDLVAQR